MIVVTPGVQEPSEAAVQLDSDPDAGSWPSAGAIEVAGVALRYRPHLPLSLEDVSFSV